MTQDQWDVLKRIDAACEGRPLGNLFCTFRDIDTPERRNRDLEIDTIAFRLMVELMDAAPVPLVTLQKGAGDRIVARASEQFVAVRDNPFDAVLALAEAVLLKGESK